MRYRTIVADPPWPYPEGFALGNGKARADQNHDPRRWSAPEGLQQRQLPYASLSLEEIRALPITALAERNCHLFLWTTNRHLPAAFGVMQSWGFVYRQTLVWHKPDANLPASIAPNSAEFILYGKRGRPQRWGTLPSSVVAIARKGGHTTKSHSQKPERFLDDIATVCEGPYLELFARRQRLGWDTWGDEALHHVEISA